MKNERIKAVIFDLDGTLLDTLTDIGKSVNRILLRHGFLENSIDDYRFFLGDGAKNLIKRATSEVADDQTCELIIKEFIDLYAENCDIETRKYDGIDSLLDFLGNKNIQCAVLSNKVHEITEKLVKIYFPLRPFVSVFGQRSGVPKKPDPVVTNEIISKFQCEPHEVAFLGDSGVDMKTAVNAGAVPVGVLWGFRERDELLESGAKIFIEHPDDMKKLF